MHPPIHFLGLYHYSLEGSARFTKPSWIFYLKRSVVLRPIERLSKTIGDSHSLPHLPRLPLPTASIYTSNFQRISKDSAPAFDFSMARVRVHTRCSKTNAQGIRCKTLVPLANTLRFPRSKGMPLYCEIHEREVLAETAMGTTPFRGKRPFPLCEHFLPLSSFHFRVFRTAHTGGSSPPHAQT